VTADETIICEFSGGKKEKATSLYPRALQTYNLCTWVTLAAVFARYQLALAYRGWDWGLVWQFACVLARELTRI